MRCCTLSSFQDPHTLFYAHRKASGRRFRGARRNSSRSRQRPSALPPPQRSGRRSRTTKGPLQHHTRRACSPRRESPRQSQRVDPGSSGLSTSAQTAPSPESGSTRWPISFTPRSPHLRARHPCASRTWISSGFSQRNRRRRRRQGLLLLETTSEETEEGGGGRSEETEEGGGGRSEETEEGGGGRGCCCWRRRVKKPKKAEAAGAAAIGDDERRNRRRRRRRGLLLLETTTIESDKWIRL